MCGRRGLRATLGSWSSPARAPPQNVPELAYVLAEAGTYTFVASVEGWQQCTPPSCVRFEVVSR